MRILIAGGGTGGHLMPGIALAEEIGVRSGGHQVLFVTERGRLGPTILSRESLPFRQIRVRGLVGKGPLEKAQAVSLLATSWLQSLAILSACRPQAVVGTGGYVCGPVLLAASVLRIPTMALALDAIPSSTLRWLSRFVREIHVSYPEAKTYFSPRRAVAVSGNPIRRSILKATRAGGLQRFRLDPAKKTVLVFGGSQGAHSLNLAFVEALPELSDLASSLQFLVQTGERDLPLVRERIRKTALRVEACAFITEMGEAYAVADLGVSRAGANTIAELVARSVPALLVPYPHAAHGHQEANARSLERLGAAEVILDRELTGSLLADRIRALLQDEARCARMRSESTRTDHARASQRIVEAVLRLGGEPAGSQ